MEQIVIVDENDNFIGVEEKEKCHDGSAFSTVPFWPWFSTQPEN